LPEPGWLISPPSVASSQKVVVAVFRGIFLLILLNLSVPLACRANPRLILKAALLGLLAPTSLDGFLPGHARMVVVDGANPCALSTSSQQYTWIDSYRPCVSLRNLSSH
jgi:hypothetical protein